MNDSLNEEEEDETTTPPVELAMQESSSQELNDDEAAQDSSVSQRKKRTQSSSWWFRFWHNCLHLPAVASIPSHWPRTYGLIFGVLGPVVMLLCMALFFGYFLAQLEAPAEIAHNNAVIATRASVSRSSGFLQNVTKEVPQICLSILMRRGSNATNNNNNNNATNVTTDENDKNDDYYYSLDDVQAEIKKQLVQIYVRESEPFNATAHHQDDDDDNIIIIDDIPDMFDFMRDCGQQVWQATEQFTGDDATTTINDNIESLSFAWIRCDSAGGSNTSNSHFNQLFGSYVRQPYKNRTKLRPDVQEAAVVEQWTRHENRLYQQHLHDILAQGEELLEDPLDARIQARQLSVQQADGFGHCHANADAGAWFWFTIMTTIGACQGLFSFPLQLVYIYIYIYIVTCKLTLLECAFFFFSYYRIRQHSSSYSRRPGHGVYRWFLEYSRLCRGLGQCWGHCDGYL